MHRLAGFGVLLICVVFQSGCGGLPGKVSGQVTLDDVPLTTGTVTFHPEQGGTIAYGAIDATGRYEAYTGAQVGMTPGDYRVTVMANGPPEEPKKPLKGQYMEPVGKLLVPEKYVVKQLSDLRAKVERGRNAINFSLRSK